jgi:hypothetical protein
VGKKLNELTQRRVILLVLAMLFSFPIFTVSTYFVLADGKEITLTFLAELEPYSTEFISLFKGFVVAQS